MEWLKEAVADTSVTLPLAALPDLARVNDHEVQDISDATANWYRGCVRRFGDYLVEGEEGWRRPIDATKIRPVDVAGWVTSLRSRGLSPATINSYLSGLSQVYTRLQKKGVVAMNPADPVPRVPQPRASPKAIAEADYLAMRDEAVHVRDRAMIDVLWDSGCRLGGLVSMRVDRIQRMGDNEFALWVEEKGNKGRWVYVGRTPHCGQVLAAWLNERIATSHMALWLAFQFPPAPLTSAGAYHVLRRLRLSAKIPDDHPANPHAFRHAAALRWLDEGLDLALVSQWLGHHSPEFTAKVYAVRTERQLRAAYFSTSITA